MTLIVNSEAASGGQAYATIYTTDADLCCRLISGVAITGTLTTVSYNLCGVPDTGFSASVNIIANAFDFSGLDIDVWIIQIIGSTAFQVELTIGPP